MSMKCSTAEFLGLERTGDPSNIQIIHSMAMTPPLMGGRGASLFGGAGLAAGLIVLAEHTGRTPIWMTGQFVSQITPPAVLRLASFETQRGNGVSQGRVEGTHDGRTVVSLLGACGSRREAYRGIWRTMPSVASPEDCEPVIRSFEAESMHDHVDIRMAEGMFGFNETGKPTGTERSLLWARMPRVRHDAAALAIIADYMPSAVGNALTHRVHCTSLDNTIRYTGMVEPDDDEAWILCENRIEFVGGGFAHGSGFLWSSDGRMLAAVSQSLTVNEPRD
jgi:acyl-CoA thioesterase II